MLATDGGNATTATESSTDAEMSVSSHPLFKAGQYVWYIGPSFILPLGNFGNIMTIVIVQRKRSGDAVINIYFTALAVVDLFTLNILLLFDWVGITFGYYLHYQHDVICKLWSNTVSCMSISGWIVVSLTSHRAMSVVWPHRVSALCTRRLVTGLILGMAAFFFVLYSHYLYGYHLEYSHETSEYICTMRVGSYATFVQQVFSYIDLVFYCLLPFICIFLANTVLVLKLRQSVREVRDKFADGGSGSEQAVAREKAANSVTLTIVVVSVSFLVLTLPVSVYYIASFIYDPSVVMTATEIAESHFTRVVTFMLMYCNNAINFYLYCLTGRKFREEFVNIFCPRRV